MRMKKYFLDRTKYGLGTVEEEELRELCNQKGWMNLATDTAYKKLFELNDEGNHIEILARCIWRYTENVDPDDIYEELENLTHWPIYIETVKQALENLHFKKTEIEIITEALRTHQDAGIAYKVIE